jgi:hypothetical protein
MPEGKRRLKRAIGGMMDRKADRPKLLPGQLGAYVNGQKTLRVNSRQDFVYVRLRNATSEVVQAFNEKVGLHWDLPVLVYRDPEQPDIWKIYGRDIGQYETWGSQSYLPPHGDSHSFAGTEKSGSDVVWVAKRQYLPMLVHPLPTGTMSVYIEPDFYAWDGLYHWWPGSGTADLSPHRATGASNGRFVTIYIDGATQSLGYLDGPEINPFFMQVDPGQYISIPAGDAGIPIAAVWLATGTPKVGWGEIYDLRQPASRVFSSAGVTGSVTVYDETALLGSVKNFDFIGAGVTVVRSGTFAFVNVPGGGGGGGGGIGIFGLDEGVPLGTGTWMNFVGAGVTATISGTTININIPGASGGASGSVIVRDEGVSLGSATGLNFVGPGVSASISGTFAQVRVPGPGVDQIGVFGLDEGVPIGTGSWLNFVGAGVSASRSGTVINIQVPGPGVDQIGIFGLDEGAPIGTGSWMNFVGAGVTATRSGTVIDVAIPGAAGGGGSGSVVLYDGDSILGSATELHFTGAGVTALVSGSFGFVDVPGGGGGGAGGLGVVVESAGAYVVTGSVLNFVGAGVAVAHSGSVAEITIAGGGGGGTQQAIFTFEGLLEIIGSAIRLYNATGAARTISKVFLAADTAPTGNAVLVDIHKNGTTIFTNQAHRPQIAAGANTGYSTSIDISAWNDGEYLMAYIDQVGSANPGRDLVVTVVYS